MDFDTTARTPLNIKTRAEDGTETTHTFEVLPLTKHRLDAVMVFARATQKSDAEFDAEIGLTVANFCDTVVRSTNGPVTFKSMWESGELSFAPLNQIAQALMREVTGNPPA